MPAYSTEKQSKVLIQPLQYLHKHIHSFFRTQLLQHYMGFALFERMLLSLKSEMRTELQVFFQRVL